MLIFVGLLIFIIVGSFLTLMFARRRNTMPTTFFNQEMFTVPEPVLADVPKRAIADSHWYIKAFMRPRRKG